MIHQERYVASGRRGFFGKCLGGIAAALGASSTSSTLTPTSLRLSPIRYHPGVLEAFEGVNKMGLHGLELIGDFRRVFRSPCSNFPSEVGVISVWTGVESPEQSWTYEITTSCPLTPIDVGFAEPLKT